MNKIKSSIIHEKKTTEQTNKSSCVLMLSSALRLSLRVPATPIFCVWISKNPDQHVQEVAFFAVQKTVVMLGFILFICIYWVI